MNGQMTIFDFIQTEYPTLTEITEAEAVRIVGESVGVEFKFRDDFWGWEYKPNKKVTCRMQYDNYLFDNNDLFLGVDIGMSLGGSSMPCDTLEEAVRFFKNEIPRYLEWTKADKRKEREDD